MPRPFLLLPLMLLLVACRDGHRTGQGQLIGCYADTARATESVKVERNDGAYVMSFRAGQPWRRVDAALRTASDAQIATLFRRDDAPGIEEALLTPDGRSGIALLKQGATLEGDAGAGGHIVIERGRPRLVVKKKCQWLFSRGHYLQHGG
ncbi:hypothetical protein ACLB90_12015 [Stenotrophomonas sp. LGBM10]|uniref:hypothetical protein n=1 Tax=Stenotrophomonas sp. LGBM10 TaxID=3390038 RepID=UPI00398ACBC8